MTPQPRIDEGERLREALHELQVLREREQASHAATRALLDCVQAYATAAEPTDATRALLDALSRATGAGRVLAVEHGDGAPTVLRAREAPGATRAGMAGPGATGDGPDATGAGAADGGAAGAASEAGGGAGGGAGNGATTSPGPAPQALPLDLFARARNIADLSVLGPWPPALDPAPYRSLVAAPLPGRSRRALCALHPERGGFSRADLALVKQLAPLLGQALAAEALADDNALLAGVIAGSPAPVAVADATRDERPVVYVNAAQARLCGAPADALAGRPLASIVAPPVRSAPAESGPAGTAETQVERALFDGAVAAGLEGRFLMRAARDGGAEYWADISLFPVGEAEAGRARHLVATQIDVTDRVAAEHERDRLRDRLTGALGVTADAFLIVGESGDVLFANAALADALPAPGQGWSPGTTLAENLHAFRRYAASRHGASRPGEAPPGPEDLHDLARSGGGRELHLPDGRSFLVRARHGADGTLVVTAANVTRLKRIEAQMRARVAAIEAARDGIVMVDAAERIVYLNRAASGLLGFDTPDAGLGRDWRASYAAPDTPGRHAVLARRKGGGGSPRTHEITRSALPADGEGRPGAVLIVRDATERLTEEARAADLRAALGRVQRQEAVGQLAAGLAHEFTNLLATINAAAHAIASGLEQGGAAVSSLAAPAHRIEDAAARAGRLVARLRDLGAPAQGGATTDLRAVLTALPHAAGDILPPESPLEVEPGDTPLPSHGADEAAHAALALARILLAQGARRARLRAAETSPETTRTPGAGLLEAGRAYAVIEVSAPGSAVAPPALRELETALDASSPGPAADRTGTAAPERELCLLALQARAAGGALEAGAADDGAPALRLYWPLAGQSGEAGVAATRPGGPSLAGATLLVVDRDRETGEVLHAFLEGLGAEVALCDSAAIAAEAIREEPGGWTAVIADDDAADTPEGDVLAPLHAPAPDLPLFLVTARAERAEGTDAPPEAAGIFTKPVDLAALADRLAALPPRGAARAGSGGRG